MPTAKTLSVLAVIVGLAITAFIVYAFYEALRTKPQNPFEAFVISKAFLGAYPVVYAVGAAIWILGTVVFLLELAGYTPSLRGLRKSGMGVASWSVIDLALAALSAAVYGALLVATAPLVIFPGFTWLRPANSLAPLFGMFFGIPGCVGVAIGNLIADIVGGYFGVGSIGGFIGNFLIAYLPYKFVRDHSFSTSASIGEFYLWGVLAQAFVSALYICWWLDFMQWAVGLPMFVTWGIIAPTILSNNITVNAVLSPILGRILYPLVKGRGLYWKDRVRVGAAA
ncbi:MAG: QueT transporter family protein [Thermofilum sp.]|nr:QueT transporter family protein [Thermofilum sp.]